ncbi:hypothetical protein AX15_000397 [Amanita polypyramis BW_CC]|nr:hypothetical protein AX15_000397 [Amanita polypyramis BW_CC]
MPSHLFRPRLPIDPFGELDIDQPWLIHPDPDPRPPTIILVLGASSQAELHLLLTSQFLTNSLVLLATHAPPPLPAHPHPTVLILRLEAPPDETGAVQLVSIFERAGHLAQRWRARKNFFGDGKIAQLAEKFPGGDFTQMEYYTAGLVAGQGPADVTASRPSTARSYSAIGNSRLSFKRNSVVISSSASTYSLPSPTKSKGKGYANTNHKIFDTILNFLPSSLPEKDILKHAILVTSLSAPFLTCTLSHQTKACSDIPKRRFSSILRSRYHENNSTHDSDDSKVPSISPARLVHILPSSPLQSNPLPTVISSSSSSASLSSSFKTVPRRPSSAGPSSLRPPFLARHPSSLSTQAPSASRSSSSSTLFIPPSSSPTSSHTQPHHQPISSPMYSKIGSQSSSLSANTTVSGCKKSKLAQTIEQFLLSFAYPPCPNLPASGADLLQSKTVPYLLAPGVFSSFVSMEGDSRDGERSEVEVLASEGRLTVAETILLGLLDVCAKGEDIGKSLKSVAGLASRAWIGAMQPVILSPKSGAKADGDALPSSPVRSAPVTIPTPALSPSGREKEWLSPMVQKDGQNGSPTSILVPNRSPLLQAESRSCSPQPSIKRPLPVVPKMLISTGTNAAEGGRSEHSGVTPPGSSLSEENEGGTEYESCETSHSTNDSGGGQASRPKLELYDPYHGSFLDPNWSRTNSSYKDFGMLEEDVSVGPVAKKGIKGRLGHGFKSLTKAVSITGLAATSISSMILSTASSNMVQRRMTRERDILRAVVV